MTLSDVDIEKYIKKGEISISPSPNFKKQLGPCSLDLHLGNVFKIFNHTEFPFIDLKSKTSVEKIMKDVKTLPGKAFIIHPNDFILAVTEENIKLSPKIMARLDGRSSLGRLGLVVHSTAARFDPGWQGKAVMELGNLGIIPIALYPGMRICAMTFEILSSPSRFPYFKHKDHKYLQQKSPQASKINQELK